MSDNKVNISGVCGGRFLNISRPPTETLSGGERRQEGAELGSHLKTFFFFVVINYVEMLQWTPR